MNPKSHEVGSSTRLDIPENMTHSHIGHFIKDLFDFITFKKSIWQNLVSASVDEDLISQDETIKIQKLSLSEEAPSVGENFPTPDEITKIQKTPSFEETPSEEGRISETELGKIFDDKNIDTNKKAIVLHLFNHLAISILKAEYILFDNYSDILNKISGFEHIEDRNEDDCGDFLIKEALRPSYDTTFPYQYTDHYLIKSLITTIWHLIEVCKTIDHKIDIDHFDSYLQFLNNDKKQRVGTIYRLFGGKEFIDKDTIDVFANTMESIIDLTLIDHYYEYTEENLNKLFSVYERINALENVLTTTDGIGQPISDTDNRYNVTGTNLLNEFKIIKEIVEYKTRTLIQQITDYHDKKVKEEQDKIKKANNEESINNRSKKLFYKEYQFIIYGIENKDNSDNLKDWLGRIKYDPPIYNEYTNQFRNILTKNNNSDTIDKNTDFLIRYHNTELKKHKRSTIENEEDRCENYDLEKCPHNCKNEIIKHCTSGKCNTKEDIIRFNDASRKAIENFNFFHQEIIGKIKEIRDNVKNFTDINFDSNANENKKIKKIFKAIENVLDSNNIAKLKYDPTNLPYLIDFFKDIIDAKIKQIDKLV